ncbi:MAG: DUF1064 domain-containing protein [Parcubacteria group bacterium]
MITLTQDQAARLGIAGLGHRRETKYHNQHVMVDGYRFDSKVEAERYGELVMLQQAGHIKDLRVHPRFCIVDKDVNGAAMAYEADFEYVTLPDMARIVEDVKSEATARIPLFRLKWRLVQARYPEYTFRVEER